MWQPSIAASLPTTARRGKAAPSTPNAPCYASSAMITVSASTTIQTRQVEILESQRYYDPIQYLTFMERINKTIQAYLAERDSEKYLSSMERMAEDYRAGRSAATYPEVIMDDGDAKAFYGAVCSGVKKSMGEMSGYNDESLGILALDIKNVVASNAKRDWRDNVIVHRDIKKELDDLLFNYMEDHEISWSLDTIDIIIDEIMMVAKKVY